MKEYEYFVSYHSKAGNSGFGFGRTKITRNKPIKDIKDIREVEVELDKVNKIESIVLFWRKFT
jgi:hypothetical protein